MDDFIKKTYKIFSSVKLALGLIISLTLLSIIGMIIPQKSQLNLMEIQAWQNRFPELSNIFNKTGLDNIFSSYLFLIIAFIFLLNTLTCTIKQIKISYKLWVKGKSSIQVNIDQLSNNFSFVSEDKKIIIKIEELVKAKGFKLIEYDNFIYGYKRRFGCWGSSIFHVGLVFIVLGVFLSFTFKTKGRVNITEGQTFTGTASEYLDFDKGSLAREAKKLKFNVVNEKVNTNIVTDNQLENYSSNIIILDKNGQIVKSQEVKTNYNLKHQGYTFYPYEYGYSPAIIIEDKGIPIFSAYSELITKTIEQRTVYSGDIKLNNQGFLVNITYIPNILKTSNPSQNNIPAIMYDFKDNSGRTLYRGSLSLGQERQIGNYKIKFPEYRMWAGFIVVKDYGVDLIYFGGVLALLGLFILYFWVPQNIYIVFKTNKDKTSTLKIGGTTKKYLVSFTEEFQELEEQILISGGGIYD